MMYNLNSFSLRGDSAAVFNVKVITAKLQYFFHLKTAAPNNLRKADVMLPVIILFIQCINNYFQVLVIA